MVQGNAGNNILLPLWFRTETILSFSMSNVAVCSTKGADMIR